MSRQQYASWNSSGKKRPDDPDGGVGPRHLLAEIGTNARTNASGGISWDGFHVFRWHTAVKSLLRIETLEGDELNEHDTDVIFQNAVTALVTRLGGGKPLDPKDVLNEANQVAAEYFRTQSTPYVFITSLSVKSLPWRSLKAMKCTIRPLQKRGNRFPLPPVAQHLEDRFDRHLTKSQYCLVRINTTGRTLHEAAARASDALGYIRGIYNLCITYRSFSMSRGHTKERPLGVIHAGPISSLHNLDGSPVADSMWIEKAFISDEELFTPKGGWKPIEDNRRTIMRWVNRLPYKRDAENLLMRYAVAVGQPDLQLALKQAKPPADFPACVGRRTAAGVGYLPRGRSVLEVVVGCC